MTSFAPTSTIRARPEGENQSSIAVAAVASALHVLAPPAPPTVQVRVAAHDVAAGSVLRAGDLMVDVEQPGIGRFPVPKPVLQFSDWDSGEPAVASGLGDDTDDVLRSVLSLGDDDLSDLRSRSVIGGKQR